MNKNKKTRNRVARKARKAHLNKRAVHLQCCRYDEALQELALANMYIDKVDDRTRFIEPTEAMLMEAYFWRDYRRVK